MILITGVTGRVGGEVHRQLVKSGKQVRVLVRDPKKSTRIPSMNTQVVAGDFNRIATLGLSLQGVKKLFLVSSSDPQQVQLHSNVIQAAKKAGVSHIVRLSAFGATQDSPVNFFQWHAKSEKELESSGVPYTHIRPNFFFQNFLNFNPTVLSDRTIYVPLKSAQISMVDVADVAAVAISCLTSDLHQGRTLDVTGPQALNFQEASEIISDCWNRTVKYVDVSPAIARESMLNSGLPEWMADGLTELYKYLGAGKGATVTRTVTEVTKSSPRNFRSFAEEYVKSLK